MFICVILTVGEEGEWRVSGEREEGEWREGEFLVFKF